MNVFAFYGYSAAVADQWGGVEIDVGAGVEVCIFAVGVASTAHAKLVVTASTLLDATRTAVTPGAQFGSDSSYSLISTCHEGNATTFANVGDCFEIKDSVDSLIAFPVPLIVPTGRSFHVLASTVNTLAGFGVIFEERTIGSHGHLPRRG